MTKFWGNNILFSLGVTILLHLFCYAFFHVFYLTHDDVAMALVSKGYFTGTPDAHLVFINIMYGAFLKILYDFIPGVEWYSVVLLAVQFVSIFIISVLIKRRTSKLSYITFCLISCYLILNLQFTNVAFVALAAGLLQLYLLEESDPVYKYILAIILIFTSYLIRADLALIGGFCAIPFLLKFHKKFIFTGVALIGLFIGAFVINQSAYSEPEWAYFDSYNKVRGAINDNPNVAVLVTDTIALKKIGLTVEELEIFNNLSPLQSMTLERLQAVQELVKYPPGIYFYLKNLFQNYVASLLFIGIAIIAFYRKRDNHKVKIALILFIILDLLICLNHYPKDRIIFSLLILIYFFSIISIDNNSQPIKICSVLFSLFFLLMMVDFYRRSSSKFEFKEPVYNNLIPLYTNYRTFFGKVRPFEIPSRDSNKVIAVSWLVDSPIQLDQFRKLSYDCKQHFSPIDDDALNKGLLYMGDTSKQSIDFINGPMTRYLKTQKKHPRILQHKPPFIIYRIESNDTIQ